MRKRKSKGGFVNWGIVAGLATVLTGSGRHPGLLQQAAKAATPASSTTLTPPDCGMADDRRVHLPTSWDSFTPPDMGHSYQDPVFGCNVVRLTDVAKEQPVSDSGRVSFMNYYSTFTAVNAADTLTLLTTNSGAWLVKDLNGAMVVSPAEMPAMNNGHPLWAATDGNTFYYTHGNALFGGTIEKHSVKGVVLYAFNEYRGIVSPDAADVSQDGAHIVLAGENANGTIDVFVWDLRSKTKTSVYTTSCKVNQWGVTQTPQPGCVHKVLLTPDNLLLIDFTNDGTGPEDGLRLWDRGALVHVQDRTNHIDTGFDLSGAPVFVGINNSETLSSVKSPCRNKWGLDVRRLSDLSSAVCLMDEQLSSHISYRGDRSQPWIAISVFDEGNRGPERSTSDPGYEKPTEKNWKLYEDEIILASVDGRGTYRLAHARSRSAMGYWQQPHAAISRDGKFVVFTSDMAYPKGCPANTIEQSACTDAYLIKVRR
jgi:hypothetical protein